MCYVSANPLVLAPIALGALYTLYMESFANAQVQNSTSNVLEAHNLSISLNQPLESIGKEVQQHSVLVQQLTYWATTSGLVNEAGEFVQKYWTGLQNFKLSDIFGSSDDTTNIAYQYYYPKCGYDWSNIVSYVDSLNADCIGGYRNLNVSGAVLKAQALNLSNYGNVSITKATAILFKYKYYSMSDSFPGMSLVLVKDGTMVNPNGSTFTFTDTPYRLFDQQGASFISQSNTVYQMITPYGFNSLQMYKIPYKLDGPGVIVPGAVNFKAKSVPATSTVAVDMDKLFNKDTNGNPTTVKTSTADTAVTVSGISTGTLVNNNTITKPLTDYGATTTTDTPTDTTTSDTNKIATNTSSILDKITSIPGDIASAILGGLGDLLTALFVPSSVSGYDNFTKIINDKVPQLSDLGNTLSTLKNNSYAAQDQKVWYVDIEIGALKVSKVPVLDFRNYSVLIDIIRNLITAILWIWFIQYLFKEYSPKLTIS